MAQMKQVECAVGLGYDLAGALQARRHRWWRVYDALFMLHIMDYGPARDDVNNTPLRIASALGLLLGATGVWLLFYSFGRRRRRDVR